MSPQGYQAQLDNIAKTLRKVVANAGLGTSDSTIQEDIRKCLKSYASVPYYLVEGIDIPQEIETCLRTSGGRSSFEALKLLVDGEGIPAAPTQASVPTRPGGISRKRSSPVDGNEERIRLRARHSNVSAPVPLRQTAPCKICKESNISCIPQASGSGKACRSCRTNKTKCTKVSGKSTTANGGDTSAQASSSSSRGHESQRSQPPATSNGSHMRHIDLSSLHRTSRRNLILRFEQDRKEIQEKHADLLELYQVQMQKTSILRDHREEGAAAIQKLKVQLAELEKVLLERKALEAASFEKEKELWSEVVATRKSLV